MCVCANTSGHTACTSKRFLFAIDGSGCLSFHCILPMFGDKAKWLRRSCHKGLPLVQQDLVQGQRI